MITIFLRSDIVATIFSLHILVWLLFEGGYIRGQLLFEGGYYSRAATIRGGLLFKGGYYSRVATFEGGYIRGRLLFEGSYYSRAATIPGRLLFEDGYYSRMTFASLESSQTPGKGMYELYSCDYLTLSVVRAASQSCCQPWKGVVQHEQRSTAPALAR